MVLERREGLGVNGPVGRLPRVRLEVEGAGEGDPAEPPEEGQLGTTAIAEGGVEGGGGGEAEGDLRFGGR